MDAQTIDLVLKVLGWLALPFGAIIALLIYIWSAHVRTIEENRRQMETKAGKEELSRVRENLEHRINENAERSRESISLLRNDMNGLGNSLRLAITESREGIQNQLNIALGGVESQIALLIAAVERTKK